MPCDSGNDNNLNLIQIDNNIYSMILLVLRKCFCVTNKIYSLSSKIGGSSQDALYDQYAGKFHNQHLEHFKVKLMQENPLTIEGKFCIPGVNIITTQEECKKCVEVLMKNNKTIVAWDTETMDLDIKREAPVGKGKIICATFFAGPQFNFGRGPRVFIDNFGKNAGLIDYFKEYLQSQQHLKCWHNYGFDRHLFYNHGINVRGFGGDTMHMARLQDSGKMFGQYSLAALTQQYSSLLNQLVTQYPQMITNKLEKEIKEIQEVNKNQSNHSNLQKIQENKKQMQNLKKYADNYSKAYTIKKKKMDDIFRRKKILKTGSSGASYEYPNTITLHTNIEYTKDWITYSILDSESTFYLRQLFQCNKLKAESSIQYKGIKDIWTIYDKYWRPFGQILTDLERNGMKIDVQHMKRIQIQATNDMKQKAQHFINFLKKYQSGKNIDHFNPSSDLQLQQLLYAPYQVVPPSPEQQKKQQQMRSFQDRMTDPKSKNKQNNNYADVHEIYEKEQDIFVDNQDQKAKRNPRKIVQLNQKIRIFKIQNQKQQKPKKVDMQVSGLGIKPIKLTPLGLPSVQSAVIQILAGNIRKNIPGTIYEHFVKEGKQQFGRQLCIALNALLQYREIETLLKTFIEPLQGYIDNDERIHYSLNINTETGRLSCRKPNLQNQPSLDKDIYKIRKAFIAEKGKKLIIADYGQLQLRILAHLTQCKAMIEAFKQGGDFHSRTAIGMYPYIKKDIDDGNILLQWDKSKGIPPVPLLKEKYANERKKAKTVNFSIAYGKTAVGFAHDWGCTLKQATEIINAWFSDRPQVKRWQSFKYKIVQQRKFTQTLLGRYRKLDRFFATPAKSVPRSFQGMVKRKAINTPIQGGAADIVIAAMIKIANNKRLKELGWKLLMQIHDELILEGPEESSIEALSLVKQDMQHPLDRELLVALQVDAKIGNNWYECK